MMQRALLIPRGLADPAGEIAYVVGQQGLIDCLDLGSGEVLARTDSPGSPLVIDRDTLIGWTPDTDRPNTIRVFAAVRQGDILRTKWEAELSIPHWVDVDSTEPNRFSLEAELQDQVLVVVWEAHSRYQGGAPPPPQVEEAAKHDERCTVRIESESGKVMSQELVETVPRTDPDLPSVPPRRQLLPYRSVGTWETRSWQIGSTEAFLVSAPEEPGIVMVRRDQAEGVSTREFRLTRHPTAVPEVTPDGRFVFVHEPGGELPSWHAFSAETGARIATFPLESGTEGIAVINDLVVYLVVEDLGTSLRRSLRCRDLRTTESKWVHPLGEEARRAPPPLRQ